MKERIILVLFATLGLRAEIEFSGFFVTPAEALVWLGDSEDHASSGWLKIGQSKIGQSFRGYNLRLVASNMLQYVLQPFEKP